MSKNEPDNDFTTRTWFVGEEGEEEQAPEDTLIPGEHKATFPSDNDSLIAGDGLSSEAAPAGEENLPTQQLEHTDSAIVGTAENPDADLTDEDESAEVSVPDVSEEDASDAASPALERKSLMERSREVDQDDSGMETAPSSEVESTADRRYSLLSGSEEATDPVEEDSPHWDSVEETEPEEVLTTAERQQSFEDTIFDGATVKPTVPSRAAAHVWSLLLFLVLVPLTWYLILDVATRTMYGWMNAICGAANC